MLQTIEKLGDLLGPTRARKAYPVLALVVVMAMVEMLGVASIMPFIAILSNPGAIEQNPYLSAVYQYLRFQTHTSFLILLGSLTLGLLIGSVLLRAVTLWAQLRFTNLQAHSVATDMVRSYLRQPYEWHTRNSSAALGANILQEVTQAFQGVAYPLMLLFANGVVAFLLITLLVVVDPVLALTSTAVVGGVYGGLYVLARRFVARIGESRVKANRGRHRALSEAFGGIKEIKIGVKESVFLSRFEAHSERVAKGSVSATLVGELPSFAMQAVIFGGMLAAILYLISHHGSLQESLPIISLYAVAGYRLLPTLQNAYKNLMILRYSLPALDALHRDVRQFPVASMHSASRSARARDEAIGLTGSLELRNICFRYLGTEGWALQNVSIVIPAYSTVAFVGSTGSGKTTLIDVILGLLTPSEGEVLADGTPISGDNVTLWHMSIGYVPQSIFLSDDSVSANIAFGVALDEVDQLAVEKAARAANLHEFVVRDLPNGYGTVIGEGGVRLSGGQRQRIGIARALYHDPDVLVLDEATSALDNLTEKAVMDAIYKIGRRKTIIMIAHRLSSVRQCDRIFVLERGQVSAAGTYEELLQNSETFRAMALRPSDHVGVAD